MSANPPDPVDDADDDDALHWAGDDARGQAAPRLRDADSEVVDAEGADAAERATADTGASDRRTAAETGLLVATGVFAAAYLGLVVGWIVSVQRLAYAGLDLAGEVMWQFAEFLAMVSPALWFAAVLTLTPQGVVRRAVKRIVWLLVGAALLLPWPFLLGAF